MEKGDGVRPALTAGIAHAGTQRLFFALWPGPEVRAALGRTARRMQRSLQGRRSRDDTLHLTLAFIGWVDVEQLEILLTPPTDVMTAGFRLKLDRWECWTHNRIGWIGPSQVPPALQELAENLESWLRGVGLKLERRRFMPHVTLVRDACPAALPDLDQPIEWEVGECVLVRSQPGPQSSRYAILGRWPLA